MPGRALSSIELLGVPVHPLSLAEAVTYLGEMTAEGRSTTVISLNGFLLMRARREVAVREAVRAAGLVIPDGIGVLLAARILGLPVLRRVAGADLTEALCGAAVVRGHSVFLLGASAGIAEAAAVRLQEQFPGLRIAGTAHGYFRPAEEPALLAQIRRAAPDILLVAFGAPRQELWLHRHAASLGVPVMMGVGGTLDVLAGRTRRAPRWLQAAGLEWLYRMMREPWRWSVVKTIPPLFLVALRERLRRPPRGRVSGATPGRRSGV